MDLEYPAADTTKKKRRGKNRLGTACFNKIATEPTADVRPGHVDPFLHGSDLILCVSFYRAISTGN